MFVTPPFALPCLSVTFEIAVCKRPLYKPSFIDFLSRYVQALEDRITVIFSTVFKDNDDVILGKIFMQVRLYSLLSTSVFTLECFFHHVTVRRLGVFTRSARSDRTLTYKPRGSGFERQVRWSTCWRK